MADNPSGSNDDPLSPADSIRAEIQRALADQSFSSEEAMRDFVNEKMAEVQRAPVADFQGLSREQMHQLIHAPFDTPELVRFAEGIEARPAATAIRLLEVIVNAAGEDGIKLTAKGNLPRAVVHEAKQALEAEDLYWEWIPGVISNEDDFEELHVIKLTAGLARFTRKERGRLKATRAIQKRIRKEEWAAIYRTLLQAYCRQFNWAYSDGFPDLHITRDAFAFSLYLFHRFGDEPRPVSFYEQCFVRAFPMALQEVEPERPGRDPEHIVQHCWSIRTVTRFAMRFGLVEAAEGRGSAFQSGKPLEEQRIRKSVLYDQAVHWGAGL